MSVTAYIKLRKGRGKTPQSHAYAQVRQFLDKVAQQLKVEPPTKFEYEDPEYFIQTIGHEYVKPAMIKRWKKQKQWHAASVGLKTFAALLEHFGREGVSAVPAGVDREGFLRDLETMHAVLKAAAKKKDSFRIEALI